MNKQDSRVDPDESKKCCNQEYEYMVRVSLKKFFSLNMDRNNICSLMVLDLQENVILSLKSS